MSNKNKQVADLKGSPAITADESCEYQRRWDEKRWERAAKEGNYDRSREHLNFEITKGCRIHSIDKTRTVGEKITSRLEQCGITDPNINRKTPNIRVCAKFIFGGSRDRMHELAFGEQKVNLTKGADNSNITRCKDIEEWAKDIYRFASGKWGENNIVGFYVHLDEMNPHIHCTILPITPLTKLSYKQVFGGATKWDFKEKMLAIHDDLAVCNQKWGLMRGSNIYETGAKHRSTEEYKKELSEECTALENRIIILRGQLYNINQQIHKAQTKQKSLTTMIKNLEKQKVELLGKKAELEGIIQTGNADTKLLLTQLDKLSKQLLHVDEKLLDKKDKLNDAEKELISLNHTVKELREKESHLRQEAYNAVDSIQQQIEYRLSSAILPDILREFRTQSEHLNFRSLDLFEDTLLKDLADQGEKIMQCALLLFAGYIEHATTFAQSNGGGGGDTDLKWGRNENEDDRTWARRCMKMAHKMMKGTKRSRIKR